MAQIQKEKKVACQVWKKRLFRRHLSHFCHICHISKKNKSLKFWLDVSVNLCQDIPTATETTTQKSSIYLLGMSNHIFKFIFKNFTKPSLLISIF